MNTLEDRLTHALERRGADVDVDDRLDDIVEDSNVIRFDSARSPGRRDWRLMSAAAAVALLAVGAAALVQLQGDGNVLRDGGTATQPSSPDDATVREVPLSSVDSLDADEWIIPTLLPDGFEFQYASEMMSATRPSRRTLFGIGTTVSEDNVVVGMFNESVLSTDRTIDVEGVEWAVAGNEDFRMAELVIGGTAVGIGGPYGTDAEFADVLASMVVVDSDGLPHAPILFGDSMTPVAEFEIGDRELTVNADESNGWFCLGLANAASSGGGSGECGTYLDPALHLLARHSATWGSAPEGTGVQATHDSLASAETSRVEVDWIDGSTTSAQPQNTSDRFPDVTFWVTGTTLNLELGEVPDDAEQLIVEVRAYGADGELLATSRDGTVTVE